MTHMSTYIRVCALDRLYYIDIYPCSYLNTFAYCVHDQNIRTIRLPIRPLFSPLPRLLTTSPYHYTSSPPPLRPQSPISHHPIFFSTFLSNRLILFSALSAFYSHLLVLSSSPFPSPFPCFPPPDAASFSVGLYTWLCRSWSPVAQDG